MKITGTKQKPPVYNDGFVGIYRKKDLTFNRNITKLSEMDLVERFAYSEMSRRQQDLEFAEQNSFSLSLKIKIPRPVADRGLDAYCYAVIGKILYGVQYLDTDRTNYFLYLEKVRELKEEQ